MKKLAFFLIFWLGWSPLTVKLFNLNTGSDYPTLRTRLGTILHHSSYMNGIYLGAYWDPQTQDHFKASWPTVTLI